MVPRRLITDLLGGFSSFALVLASLGLYGVSSYSVGQRTREIGIRLAIGGQQSGVFRLIVGEGLKLAVIGVVLGLIGALLVTRVLKSQLFGVTSMDPFSFTITAVIRLAVALIACFVPARMANKVDPMVVLRYE